MTRHFKGWKIVLLMIVIVVSLSSFVSAGIWNENRFLYDTFNTYSVNDASTNATIANWTYGFFGGNVGQLYDVNDDTAGAAKLNSGNAQGDILLWPEGSSNSFDGKLYGTSLFRYSGRSVYAPANPPSFGVCDAGCVNKVEVGFATTTGAWVTMYLNFTFDTATGLVNTTKVQSGVPTSYSDDISSLDEWYPYVRAMDGADSYLEWWDVWYHTTAAAPSSSVEYINLSQHVYPLNQTQFGTLTTINFNITGNYSSNANVSLFINGTLYGSTTAIAGKEVYTSFSIPLTTGAAYSYFINATNISTSTGLFNGSAQSDLRTFFIDTTDPTIQFNLPNHSIYMYKNLTVQFNISDDFLLFSYNVSIDGNQYQSQINLNTKSYGINFSRNVTNLTTGYHTLRVRFADGHTAKELGGDYEFSNGLFNNRLEYDFWDGGNVKIEPELSSIFDTFTTERKTDRYTFDYEPDNNKRSQYSFIVDSRLPIHIIENEGKYKNYLIVGEHWLDFVLDDQPQSTVTIQRLRTNKVNVTVGNLNSFQKLRFNSVGDLNVVIKDINFTVGNLSQDYSKSSIELKSTTFLLRLNKTAGIDLTNAHLFYNGTLKSSTKTSLSGYDLYTSTFETPVITTDATEARPFTWVYFLNGTGFNETGNTTAIQTVSELQIDNCTTLTQRGLNITLKDSTNSSLLNGTIDGYFQVWVSDINNFIPFNLSWNHHTENSPVGVCFSPKEETFNFYSQFEYDSAGYQKKLYYIENQSMSNQTKKLDLFLEKGTTQVTFTVNDVNGDPVPDAIIKVLTYDLGTHSYKLTEVLKTDTNGQSFGQIILNTQFYQFRIVVDDTVVLQDGPTIITSTTKIFTINLETDFFAKFTTVREALGDVTFTNSSLNFRFDYDDPSLTISQACLEVRKSNINSDVRVNITCSTNPSGILLSKIPDNPEGTTYFGVGTFYFSDGSFFVVDTAYANFNYVYKKFGLQGIFIGFFLVLALALIGIFNPVVSVMLALVGVFALSIMNIIGLGTGAMISLAIMSFIIIYRLSRG